MPSSRRDVEVRFRVGPHDWTLVVVDPVGDGRWAVGETPAPWRAKVAVRTRGRFAAMAAGPLPLESAGCTWLATDGLFPAAVAVYETFRDRVRWIGDPALWVEAVAVAGDVRPGVVVADPDHAEALVLAGAGSVLPPLSDCTLVDAALAALARRFATEEGL